jgi:CBS domain-containing protein
VSDVAKVLEGKGSEVLTIDAEATVFEAIKRMVDANVGALLVTDGGRVVGIVTERDYLRRVTLEGRTEKETLVREIMTSPPVYVTPETSVEECMAVMTERRIRHLPVFAGGRDLVGVVSIGDLVKFKSKEQDFQIRFLTEYIESG